VLGLAVALASSPPGRNAARAVFFLLEVTGAPVRPLTWLSRPPVAEDFVLPTAPGRSMEATLYRPAGAGTGPGARTASGPGHPAVLVYVPMAAPGADRELTHHLARLGFVVLVPFPEPERWAVAGTADPDDVAAAFTHLQAVPGVAPERTGIFAISYGAGPALIAAARDELRDRVAFVVSLGGYADLRAAVRFAVTGAYEYSGPAGELRGQVPPDPYARQIFLRTLVSWVDDPNDRGLVERHADALAAGGPEALATATTAGWWEELSPGGRVLARIIATRDPAEFDALYPLAPRPMLDKVAALSPLGQVHRLRAALLVVHSTDDPFIPYTESLRLLDALPPGTRVRWALVDSLRHAVPAELDLKTFFRHYLRDGWRLFMVAYHLVAR